MMTTTSTFRRSSANAPVVHVRVSTRDDGDFHLDGLQDGSLAARRRAFVDLLWVQLTEPHGVDAIEVTDPAAADASVGDIAVTSLERVVLGCWTADCVPVGLVGPTRIAVAHAGWRGIAGGVVGRAVDALNEPLEMAFVGPAIGPCCYEFGSVDAGRVAAGVGVERSAIAFPAGEATCRLDLLAAIDATLPVRVTRLGSCTGCTYDGFSHRVRRDSGRHVMAVWQVLSADETETQPA